MVDPEIAKEWIDKANEDFDFAFINFKEEKPFFPQICFHLEQSAEKYLKAYIITNDLEFRKTHDLTILVKVCESNDSAFAQLIDACEYLNTFYIETRYPVHWPTHFSRDETKRALDFAETIRSFITEKLDMPHEKK